MDDRELDEIEALAVAAKGMRVDPSHYDADVEWRHLLACRDAAPALVAEVRRLRSAARALIDAQGAWDSVPDDAPAGDCARAVGALLDARLTLVALVRPTGGPR